MGFGGGFQHPLWTNIDVSPVGSRVEGNHKGAYRKDIDIVHDLLDLTPLPIESDSAELIHSRFTVEHITDQAAQNFFNEAFRSLKGNGVLRLVSPNIELDYRAYLRGDLSHFYWRDMFSSKSACDFLKYSIPLNRASLEQVFLIHFASNASPIHSDGAQERISDEVFKEVLTTMPLPEALDFCTAKCSVDKQRIYRQNHINWWNIEKYQCMLHKAGFQMVYTTGPGQSVSPVMREKRNFDNLWQPVALYMEAIKI